MTAASAAETRDSESRARSVVESAVDKAHKVALAGVGAAGEAADAGAKVFDRLVARGEKVESQSRESLSGWRDKAEEKVQQVRSAAGKGIEQTKAKARTGIDEHLERRLEKLGVPGKADLEAVIERLSAVEARLDALEKPKPRRRTTKKKASAKARAAPQGFGAGDANVETAEVEAVVGGADRVHRLFELGRVEVVRVQEDRPARVGADLGQFDSLAGGRDVRRRSRMFAPVDVGDGDGTRVVEDQPFEGAGSVAAHGRPHLVGDREDVTFAAARVAGPEHAVLFTGHVLLRKRRARRLLEESGHVGFGARHGDAATALAGVRLEHDRIVEVPVLQEVSQCRD